MTSYKVWNYCSTR